MSRNTQELANIIKAAQDATKDVEEAHLRDIAFDKVLSHLLEVELPRPSLEKQGSADVSTAGLGEHSSTPADATLADVQQRADAVAHYFKISPDQVDEIFDLTDSEPSLAIRSTQLAQQKSKATKEIVLLLTGVRTALGEDTTTEHIRQMAEDYSKLDGPNFMKALTGMPGIAVLGKRNSTNRVVRMKVRGAEEAQEFAQALLAQ